MNLQQIERRINFFLSQKEEILQKKRQRLEDEHNKVLQRAAKLKAEMDKLCLTPVRTITVDFKRLYKEKGSHFNQGGRVQELARHLSTGYLCPVKQGNGYSVTIGAVRDLGDGWEVESYQNIYQALRRISSVYGLTWDKCNAGIMVQPA